jgi:TonB family protein
VFHFRFFILVVFTFGLSLLAQADLAAMDAEFNAQIAANDIEAAHSVGEAYYQAANAQDDHETAGRVAYTMASIASLREQGEEVPIWFDRCARHYEKLGADAQRVDCIHKAALSYKSLGKTGTTRDRLKSAERALEAANATDTIVAALIYADLAESYIPPQFEVRASAKADRERVLEYTKSARDILLANGQEQHFLYASLLAREATALEDLERFEEAMAPMEQAMQMLADKPEHESLYADLRRRYYKISASTPEDKSDRNKMIVEMEDGREVTLKIKRRTRVIYPRSDGLSSEYGIGRVLITLAPDGKVATVEIIESQPSPAFGEAVKKAVKKWTFTPEDETPPETIPPFPFGVSFDYVRSR